MQSKQKLHPEDIVTMRKLYAEGAPQGKLAKLFQIDKSLVSRIVNYKRKVPKTPHKIIMPKWYLEEI